MVYEQSVDSGGFISPIGHGSVVGFEGFIAFVNEKSNRRLKQLKRGEGCANISLRVDDSDFVD